MQPVTVFPTIVRVEIPRHLAEEAAQVWRDIGYLASVAPRTLRAHGAAIQVFAVVLTGRKSASP